MRGVSRTWCAGVVWCLIGPAAAASAQVGPGALVDRRANLEVRDVTLADALRRLQLRSGVPIAFSPELLPTPQGVRCDCIDATVGEALEAMLADFDLVFQERRSQILILPRPDGDGSTAASTGAVVGFVRQAGNGMPVAAARVAVPAHGLATMTDADGRFILLPVPAGPIRVDVDALGYASVEGLMTRVGGEAPTTLTVELEPDPLALAEIVVAPGTFAMLEDAALRPQTLSRADMETLPQLGEDVFRAMERLPGVATDDISARMRVRGGNDDELLILLDGNELFEPFHLRDLDAILSIVDVAALRGASLQAGGLPTEYGDRLTGLLDMRTRQPLGGATRHSIGLSASNVTARSQGVFAEGRGGWLVSGRRGFLDLILAMAAASEGDQKNDDLSPRYFDVLGKVELLPSPAHRVSVNALYAGDHLDISVDDVFEQASLGTRWTNANAWVGWDWKVSAAVDVSTVASLARLGRTRLGELASPGSSESADFADVEDRGDFTFTTVRQDWKVALGGGPVLKMGGQVRWASSEYRYRNWSGREFVQGDGTLGVEYDSVDVTLDPTSVETSVYVAARVQPASALTVEAGTRYDDRSHTGDADVSPRLHAALELGRGTTVRASWGVHRQSHGVEELSVVDGDTLFFPSERADQLGVGVEHRLAGGGELRVEAYDRRVSEPRPRYLNLGREIVPFPEVGHDRVRYVPDAGRAQGLEVTASAPLGRARWTAAYVLARAEDRVDGAWVPRTLDQRHAASLRWQYAPSDRWQVSAAWQYHTGWPSTPMEFQVDTIPGAGPGERQILVNERPGPINARTLPAYHRLDVRATRSFDVGRGRLSVFLDVFNLYNRRNLRSYDYKVSLPDGAVIAHPGETLLPLLPSFGFTWAF